MTQMTLLVVDDEPVVIDLICEVAGTLGFDPFVATNGRDALMLVLQHKPNIILCDLHLPDLDGTALCRIVKEQLPETRMVLMTGSPDAEKGSCASILYKPFGLKALSEAILGSISAVPS